MTALIGSAFALTVIAIAFGLYAMRRLQAFAWGGRLPGRFGALPVEEVEADAAPRGWKCAQLLVSPDGGQVRLAAVAIGGVYAVEDTAVCVLNRGHLPPALSCECGFYAFRDRADAVNLLACRLGYDGQVVVRTLCEVDLSGTVLECERGYRAERQRVLQVGVLPWCADCAARRSLVAAQVLGTEARPAEEAPPPLGGYAGRVTVQPLNPSVQLRRRWPALRPLCERCAQRLEGGGLTLTPLEATGRLGTEVRWLDAGLVPRERVLAGHRPPSPWRP